MAEPATDVGTDSTFTMLYIAVLESKGKDHWDQCCHSISPKNVSPEALQRIPRNHANKVLVRMEDSLLNKWFAACQVISETVIQVFHEFDVATFSFKANILSRWFSLNLVGCPFSFSVIVKQVSTKLPIPLLMTRSLARPLPY